MNLHEELERMDKDLEEFLEYIKENPPFNMNVYVYENRSSGEVVYSLDNYTYEEMNEKNLNGGNIMDAQDAIMWADAFSAHINKILLWISPDEIAAAMKLRLMLYEVEMDRSLYSLLFDLGDDIENNITTALKMINEDIYEASPILRKILTKFIEGRDDSFTRRMYDYRPETAL